MDGIDKAGGAGDLARLRPATTTGTGQVAAPTPAPQPSTPSPSETANLISLLADVSPPIDTKKVELIQHLIASGAFPLDAHAIASKMLALDFPSQQGEDPHQS